MTKDTQKALISVWALRKDSISRRQTVPLLQTLQGGEEGDDAPEMGVPWARNCA